MSRKMRGKQAQLGSNVEFPPPFVPMRLDQVLGLCAAIPKNVRLQ
jgi:hypothetical protein